MFFSKTGPPVLSVKSESPSSVKTAKATKATKHLEEVINKRNSVATLTTTDATSLQLQDRYSILPNDSRIRSSPSSSSCPSSPVNRPFPSSSLTILTPSPKYPVKPGMSSSKAVLTVSGAPSALRSSARLRSNSSNSIKSRTESVAHVRYIGCVGISESMKSMSFETRSVVAKECMLRVCEAAGLRPHTEYAELSEDPQIQEVVKMLDPEPDMTHSLTNVTMTVSVSSLKIDHSETGVEIANHVMSCISFASGGDADMRDFVAYVAKDHEHGRACFVLQCNGSSGSQEVITMIGSAFEARFQQIIKKEECIDKVTYTNNNETSPNPNSGVSSSLEDELWFHGVMTRKESEQLLTKDGDFLVRESCSQAGQYILTAKKDDCNFHVLLVDPDGVIRTLEREFVSVSHLIEYYQSSGRSLTSQSKSVFLLHPVMRSRVLF